MIHYRIKPDKIDIEYDNGKDLSFLNRMIGLIDLYNDLKQIEKEI